jgi:hypothetical protein
MRKTGIATCLSFIALVLLAAACGGKPDTRPTTGSSPGSESDWEALLAVPANPLLLSVTPDENAAASEVFSYEGGTLSATGADGTTYALQIPEGALYAPTEIRMTPLSAVEGMPFGEGAPYGVLLEPDGLRLSDVAILTVTPRQAIPVDQQIFFGFQGDEHEFGFAAPVVDSPALEIMVTHFSGYGVQKGLLADTEPVRDRLGGDVERRLQDVVARELSRLRQKALLGIEDPADEQAMQDLFAWLDKVYYEEVLKPRLDAAGESCAAGRLALLTLLGYERQLQLLGVETSHLSDAAALMFKVGEICLQEEYELCRDQHIIHRIIPVVLGMMRQSELLGIDDAGAIEAKGNDLARKCLSFELELRSEIVGDPPQGWYYESGMTSKVRLEFPDLRQLLSQALDGEGDGIHGEAPLVNERFFARSNTDGCEVTGYSRGGSTLRISQLAWAVAFHDEDDEVGYVKDLSMVISPDPTTESFSGRCGPSAFTADNSNSWSGAWGALHQQACMPSSAPGSSGEEPETGLLSPEMISQIQAFGQRTGMDPQDIQDLIDAASSGDLPPGALESMIGAGAPASDEGGDVQYGLGACQTEKGWEVKAGEVFAIKEVHLSLPKMGMTEDGTYVLMHTPK